MPVNRRVYQEGLLMLAAAFAIFWAVMRACVQAMTLDEADTYFWFASGALRKVWVPFPNNHVLNTLLIWVTTHLFGMSALAVRTPALLGAVLYVGTCYFLVRNITSEFHLQFPLFICLIFNPYILDFMSAARGYSLADAFLLAAIAVPVWYQRQGTLTLPQCCALSSLALGLSFGANFSFAFVDVAAFVVLMIWAARQATEESVLRVAAWCILPGLLIGLLLGGYPLTHWPKGQLWYGAHSLQEMRKSLLEASLDGLNSQVLAVEFYKTLSFLRPLLPLALLILCIGRLVATRVDGSWMQNATARSLGRFGSALAFIAGLSVLVSWLAFRFYNLPLPMGRTGIYLIPLCTLVAGVIAAVPARSVVSGWLGGGLTAVFILVAGYYLFCLRYSYFREYEWDADMKDVYSVLAQLNHEYGADDVAASGFFVSPLNFYRVLSNRESFREFQYVPAHQFPPDKSIFVLYGPDEGAFMKKERLTVIYRGKSTPVVVAVKPDSRVPAVGIER